MDIHNRFVKPVIAVGAAAVLIVGVSACGSGSSGQGANPPSKGVKTLRWLGLAGTATWANTLDPAMVTDSISNGIIQMVDAGLVKLLPDGTPVAGLAKSWTVSDHGLVYTFYLRPNLKFSNGDKLTASDVSWSIKRALAPATKSPVGLAYLGHIQGAAAYNSGSTKTLTGLKVVNPTTIQFTLDQPIAFFLKTLTYPTSYVLDPKVVSGHPSQTYITDNCAANVGAGQFKFKCRGGSGFNSFYAGGSTPSITLVPNKNYFGPKPNYDVYMPAIPDAQTNYKDFESGGIDATGVPSTDVSGSKSKAGFIQYPTSIVDYMTPNETSAPFNNVHCRLAVAYAINRNEVSTVLHGTEVPTYSVVPRGMLSYYSGSNNPHYNPAKAKAELAQCPGGLNGLTITYQHTSVDVDNEYAAIQNMLQAVGINMKVQGLTFNGWLNVVGQPLAKTGTKITENLWIEDYPDPYDYLTLLLRAGENYDIGGFNNAQYNKIVDEAAVDQNQTTRAALYRQAQHIALSQGAWISIGNSNAYDLVNASIHGFVGSPALGLVPKGNNWANISWS